jgi:hypothetical protein
MRGRQRLLSDACLSTRTRTLALRVTVYGLAEAGELNQQTNGSGRFILNINTSPKGHLHLVHLSYSAKSTVIQQCFSLTINQQTVLSATINQRNEQAISVSTSQKKTYSF